MIRIYGASDDLIEVEGDIREEFTAGDHDVLAFSDGTLLAIEYDDNGMWRISPLVSGSRTYEKIEATLMHGSREDGTPAYSDVVTLKEPVRGYRPRVSWVVHGQQWAKAS